MLFSDKDLYAYLKELKVIDQVKLDKALSEANQANLSLHDYLLEKNLIEPKDLGQLVADHLHLPFIDLSQVNIDDNVLHVLPKVVATNQLSIVFKRDKDFVHLATSQPKHNPLVNLLQKKTGQIVKLYYATLADVQNCFGLYQKEASQAFEDIINQNVSQADKSSTDSDPPIIKLVDTIISYAYTNHASDIHIEPQKEFSLVRFRIDSLLHDIVKLPVSIHPQIVSRIKVLAGLRTDERLIAQDGKIIQKTDREDLDLRVSTVPVTEGEKIVMRLLSEENRQYSLATLGLSPLDRQKLEHSYHRPHGMILVTGPTGSGKTTTMYAILKQLNNRNVNIVTIEDPVEYDIGGINQIQVNNKTGLTFSKGLRSIVRQDPDIILVGEIRDKETADIAVNAAMTGHLVLSTLHTNNAATTIPRLIDLEVEPFLISSSVNIVIAQRLVRKICPKCRFSTEVTRKSSSLVSLGKKAIDYLFPDKKSKIHIYSGKGCPVCHQTGYLGRVGIFELMVVDDQVRQAITDQKNADYIEQIAVKNGMKNLLENGLDKVISGDTSVEEVLRVTKE